MEPAVPPSPQRQARSRYQRGMLAWLQAPGDPEGLPQMRAALRQLEQAAAGEFHAFWRTAETFLRAVSDGTLAVDAESRRLCARIDLQMRAAVNGAAAPEDGLTEELRQRILQGAGQLPPVPELISLMAQPEAPNLDPLAVEAWRQAGVAAIAAWVPATAADPAPFRRALIDLCGAAIRLGLPETLHLAEALAGAGDRLDDREMAHDPYLRAAVTAALELLADAHDLGRPVFAQRVEHVARRLEDCRRSQRPSHSPVLLRLFAGEIREKADTMRDELARLHPEAQVLVDAALAVAEQAIHLDLPAAQHLAEALAEAATRAPERQGFDQPELREALEAALAELDTMADYLQAEQALLDAPEVIQLLATV